MDVLFGGEDSSNGAPYVFSGAWCQVCGALDFGGGENSPRYRTTGLQRGSHSSWTVEPPCREPGLRVVTDK